MSAGVLLGLVALVALLVGATFTVARTHWGGELVRKLALPRINAALAGHVDVGRFDFAGREITLEHVVLRDPEGGLVAEVARLHVAYSPTALFARHVLLHEIAVEQPRLFLRQDSRGYNLTRALAPSHPAPEVPTTPAPTSPSHFVVDLQRVTIKDGLVDLLSAPAEGAPGRHVEARKLAVNGTGHLDLATGSFKAQIALGADMAAPIEAPLTATLSGEGQGGSRRGRFALSLGEARLAGEASMADPDHATARLTEGHVPAALVKAFASSPLRADVDLSLFTNLDGDVLKAQGTIRAAATTLELHGTADRRTQQLRQLVLQASHVDLGALLTGAPRSAFDISLSGHGGGPDLAHLQGGVALDIPPGLIDGRPFGPVVIRARDD